MRLGLLFPLYIIGEILAFYLVGRWIGFGWAILVLGILFVLGIVFANYEMRAIARRAATHPQSARPGQVVGDYGLLFAGLVGVALPGYITSVTGILCILPPTRAIIRRVISRTTMARLDKLSVKTFTMTQQRGTYGSFAPVIDEEEIKKWSDNVNPEDFDTPRTDSDEGSDTPDSK
ncbi:phage T7 F exclusion suppressor FxsA [Corynebacterium ciconiae DSM 44920]|uniref:FxsA family protein n=1 Tax=Corynebacterium ciconiae TaxID=227319 RepID=UPI00035CC849|nr:FxsA family protein [Corynebacterium ciconiae]WKD61163.1 phage T7 F exclusion suppressor FxsA [Corynebacterium ciconiae DSM 44920]